jgi:hypothetical protein
MAHLNGKGPDEQGPKTGRGIGRCASSADATEKLGIGLGLRRQSGGGEGRGRRLKSGLK